MHSQSQEDIFESMLKAAIMENSLEELEEYPADSELNQIQIPEKLDKTMHRIIRTYTIREKDKNILRMVRKGVSAAMIILGVSFAFLLCSQDIRAACAEIIVRIYEKYIEFDASGAEVSAQPLQLNYIPEGYSLETIESYNFYTICLYKNNIQNEISLSFSEKPITLQLDNENYEITSVTINGKDGTAFISKNSNFPNILTWRNDFGYFKLVSILDKAEMNNMAESVK